MSDRLAYRPPRIEPIGVTTVGKHPVHDVSSLDQIDGAADIGALVDEFGSPLFVVSEPGIRASIRAFRAVFTASGVDTRVAYSYKTNYLPAVCRIFHEEGALAEVVSGMEYSLARALGMDPVIADLGGGFPSSNRLKPLFDRPHALSPEDERIAPFAEAILNPLCRAKDAFGEHPTLILEPGRAVVDSPVTLITTVVATKENAGHQAGVVIDAGVNLLPTAYWYDHEVAELTDGHGEIGGTRRPVSIFGPLCMQIDVVRENALLPPMTVGTPLAIANVGAYSISQSMQFIQERPAVVLMGPDGPELIRRRETWRDVFALDEVPERLRGPGHAF